MQLIGSFTIAHAKRQARFLCNLFSSLFFVVVICYSKVWVAFFAMLKFIPALLCVIVNNGYGVLF